MLSSLLKLPVNPLSKLTGCHANRRITGSFNKVIGKGKESNNIRDKPDDKDRGRTNGDGQGIGRREQ